MGLNVPVKKHEKYSCCGLVSLYYNCGETLLVGAAANRSLVAWRILIAYPTNIVREIVNFVCKTANFVCKFVNTYISTRICSLELLVLDLGGWAHVVWCSVEEEATRP